MWRSIFAVVLLPSLTAAQSPPAPPVSPGRPNPARAAKLDAGPKYKSFTFYDSVRRGRDEEVVVRVSVPGMVTTSKSPAQGIVPLGLELEPADGLTVSALRYPKTTPKAVKFQSQRVAVAWGGDIRFKIRADRNAVLGARVLKGKITFQTIPYDGLAPGPVQKLDVQIPISVVDHHAKVQKQSWPIAHTPVVLIVVLIVLAVALFPLILPIYLICAAEGSPGCD